MDTEKLQTLLKVQSDLIAEILKSVEQLSLLWKIDKCKGCGKYFNQDNLQVIGDNSFCVGCAERK